MLELWFGPGTKRKQMVIMWETQRDKLYTIFYFSRYPENLSVMSVAFFFFFKSLFVFFNGFLYVPLHFWFNRGYFYSLSRIWFGFVVFISLLDVGLGSDFLSFDRISYCSFFFLLAGIMLAEKALFSLQILAWYMRNLDFYKFEWCCSFFDWNFVLLMEIFFFLEMKICWKFELW